MPPALSPLAGLAQSRCPTAEGGRGDRVSGDTMTSALILLILGGRGFEGPPIYALVSLTKTTGTRLHKDFLDTKPQKKNVFRKSCYFDFFS